MSQPISAHTGPIEEETVPNYSTSSFYPVHIGHIYHKRYQVEVKLGYGGFSTVWLCRDQKDDTYKVLKVATWSQAQNRESEVLKYLKHCTSQHHGQHRVRRSCDSFTIKARGGLHQCLVFEPLGRSLAQYVELQPGWRLTTKAVAQIAKDLLLGLDYMHSYLVVHADLKPANILLSPPADGDAILTRLINAERADPSQRKVIDEQRTIYTSRAPEYGNDLTSSIVCDLGLAVFSRHQNSFRGRIQALPYRAPEVILDMRWGSSADIWSLGVMVCDIFSAPRKLVDLFMLTNLISSGNSFSPSIFLEATRDQTA
ncbi:MAG: hypothetical protein M1818_004974 [Claussenomyces sp. TS43310]|nr:MAG: hypothetical protein M1818_004974 [Claussenomyces sp. TS43310]